MKNILFAAVASIGLLAATTAFAEGNGEPFGIPQHPVFTAQTVARDTGSNGYPTFDGGTAGIVSRTVVSETGSNAYPRFAGQSALVDQPQVQASN